MANASLVRDGGTVERIATSSLAGGKLIQDADGKAIVVGGLKTVSSGDLYSAIKGPGAVVKVAKASGTLFEVGEDVWWDISASLAVRRLNASAATGDFYIGKASEAGVSGQTMICVELNAGGRQVLCSIEAVVNDAAQTAEQVIGTCRINGGQLRPGSVIDFSASIVATLTNSTDTSRFRVRLGGISGTILADTGAIDLANDDSGVLEGKVQVRTTGVSGTFGYGSQSMLKTTAAVKGGGATLDTTADTTLVVTSEKSTNNAGNINSLHLFEVGLTA